MHAAREPEQRVSALEQEHQPPTGHLVGERLQRAAHRREAALGGEHPAERIVLVRVEAGRDDDQVRAEGLRDGQEDLVEGRAQVGVGPSRGERHVHRVAGAGALARLVGRTGPRVEGELVHRLVEHVAALPERRLRPVPVVHVPVQDEHPRCAERPRRLGRHRGVVEEAEPHHLVRLGVVTGRADQREGRPVASAEHRLHRLDGRACRRQRRVVGAGRGEGVHVDGHVAACQPSELLQQLRLVHPGDFLGPGQPRRLELEGGEAVLLEVVERPRQAQAVTPGAHARAGARGTAGG